MNYDTQVCYVHVYTCFKSSTEAIYTILMSLLQKYKELAGIKDVRRLPYIHFMRNNSN